MPVSRTHNEPTQPMGMQNKMTFCIKLCIIMIIFLFLVFYMTEHLYPNAPQGTHRFFVNAKKLYADDAQKIKKAMNDGIIEKTSHREIQLMLAVVHQLWKSREPDCKKEAIFDELLKGGYMRFEDDGALYDDLLNEFGTKKTGGHLRKRRSSHQSIVPQYALFGKVTKEVLFGVTVDENGKKHTWMQFEAHSTTNILEIILHMIDYIIHKFTGKNVGPYGLSQHTEHNSPITIKPQ